MLRLLIPLVDEGGAPVAARHAAFLFREHCVSEVELLEVRAHLAYGRELAFYPRGRLMREDLSVLGSALQQTRAILEDAGVPYTTHRAQGDAARSIARRASEAQSDLVLIDASRFHFIKRWWTLAKLWRLTFTPVTLLH